MPCWTRFGVNMPLHIKLFLGWTLWHLHNTILQFIHSNQQLCYVGDIFQNKCVCWMFRLLFFSNIWPVWLKYASWMSQLLFRWSDFTGSVDFSLVWSFDHGQGYWLKQTSLKITCMVKSHHNWQYLNIFHCESYCHFAIPFLSHKTHANNITWYLSVLIWQLRRHDASWQ